MNLQERLFEICEGHVLPHEWDVVIHEPYPPFVPPTWNGAIVLAEAQNLSKKNGDGYIEWLEGLSSRDRIRRLYLQRDRLGVQPWDDNSLKIAIASALKLEPETIAVGNAALWSQVDTQGGNANPSKAVEAKSSEVWAELLSALEPRRIIAAGKVSKRIIMAARGTDLRPFSLDEVRLPSRTAMSRIAGMFSESDLLTRYPEVAHVLRLHPEWFEGAYRRNKVFFASHVVSMLG